MIIKAVIKKSKHPDTNLERLNIFTRNIILFELNNNLLFPLLQLTCSMYTVSLYNLEDKQKPRTKPSMYPINIHIGELKGAFI